MSRPAVPSLTLSFICLTLVACTATASQQSEATSTAKAPTASVDVSATQCGFVSTRQGIVPKSDDIFTANITEIDGRSTPFMRANRQQVDTGSHTLTISEAIDQRRLSSAQLTQIRKMKKFALARAYKPLVVDVKPGMTYRIGARLHRDKLDTQSIQDNAYWEPVVWQEVAEPCP